MSRQQRIPARCCCPSDKLMQVLTWCGQRSGYLRPIPVFSFELQRHRGHRDFATVPSVVSVPRCFKFGSPTVGRLHSMTS